MQYLAILLCAFIGFTACGADGVTAAKETLPEIKKLVADGKALIVDVREKAEWDAGHLQAAKLVPLSELKAGAGGADLPKDKPVFLHCRSGKRSMDAAAILLKRGIDARPLTAGFDTLIESGFEKSK